MSEAAPNAITDGVVVSFLYTLTDSDGEVIESADPATPAEYLHGAQNIVPGLERQMAGRRVGDRFRAQVPAAEAYGEHDGSDPFQVPLEELPEGIEEGMPLMAQTEDGHEVTLWVVSVEDEAAILSPQHPLAGVDLTFDVEVVGLRASTAEERDHGHPHGPGGHHH
jgi:FKBP-type peptidyl-prolyl cis-trans isomerase SlyD